MQYKSLNIYAIKSKNLQNMHYAWICSTKGQNMQTCMEKVSLSGVIKSWNEYLQSLRSVIILYKNMHLHGNLGSSYQSSEIYCF